MTVGRDDDDRLVCPDCTRPIGGLTGLDELFNLRAHRAEHHDESLSIDEALEMRAAWESPPAADPAPTSACPRCGALVEDVDGFGVLAHDECGYCSHPDAYGGVCLVCGAVVG